MCKLAMQQTYVCQLQHGELARVADIEWPNLVTIHHCHHALYQVIDVLEGARLQRQSTGERLLAILPYRGLGDTLSMSSNNAS